jgi:hypothetical protein
MADEARRGDTDTRTRGRGGAVTRRWGEEETMRKGLIILFSMFLVISLVSCGPKRIPKENLDAMNRVVVLSLMGDNIEFIQIGTTVFNNVKKYHLVKDWMIDDYIEGLIKDELAKNQQFKVCNVEFDREKMNDTYKVATRLRGEHNIKKVKEYLQELASSNNVDTLFLVAYESNELENPRRRVQGYTLYNRSLFGKKLTTQIYLTLVIEVVDLRMIKSIARRYIFTKKYIDNSYWQEEIKDLTDDQVLFIKKVIFDNLKEVVSSAVNELMNKGD